MYTCLLIFVSIIDISAGPRQLFAPPLNPKAHLDLHIKSNSCAIVNVHQKGKRCVALLGFLLVGVVLLCLAKISLHLLEVGLAQSLAVAHLRRCKYDEVRVR